MAVLRVFFVTEKREVDQIKPSETLTLAKSCSVKAKQWFLITRKVGDGRVRMVLN